MLEVCPRSATAVSLSDETKVMEVAEDEISAYLSENPDRVMALMEHLSNRLSDLTRDYNDVSAVIGEMQESEKETRKESLWQRIRKHMAAYKNTRMPSASLSAEYFNNMMEEHRTPEWYNKLKTYEKGIMICREGETIRCMYELQQGRVGIYTGYGTDREKKIGELFPAAFFGEAGMIRNEPRSASVVALEETTVDIIYRDDLDELFRNNPPKIEMILKSLAYRLRTLTRRYLEACALVSDAAEDEEKTGKMSPELAEKIRNYKARLYD